MRRTLPPLATVRPFEAAARLGSFTAAADELCLTQGAVSLQIRNLETFVGKQLFERKTRRVDLTEDGRQFAAACQRALDELERATRVMISQRDHSILTVSALPTLATVWLMPKLNDFAAAHPDVEVRVATSISPVDLRASDIDVAIRVGKLPGKQYHKTQPGIDLVMTERWDGVVADYLFGDTLVPVLAKQLLLDGPPIGGAKDLLAYSLIHTASRQNAWRDWLGAQGVSFRSRKTIGEYGHFFMALQAARDAKGIALIPRKLFEMYEQRSSDLCIALECDVPSAGEYYMLIHESRIERIAVQKFRNWILHIVRPGAAQVFQAERPAQAS